MFETKKAAVIGAGFMGSSIALLCAQNGIETVNTDISEKQLDKAKAGSQKVLSKLVDKGKITSDESDAVLSRLSFSTELSDISDADVIIEAVTENLELKKKLLGQIEANAREDALILSNTSGLSITEIVKDAKIPERIMCAHFFSPPTVMKLVELIRSEKTSDEAYNNTFEFTKQIGKQAVNAPELPGFIVNRLLIPMINDAAFLHMQGAGVEDIDTAMKLGANHPMGPLELGDYIGLDVVLIIMQTLQEGLNDDKYLPCPLIEQMVGERKLGRKTGQGFYNY